MVAVLGVLCAVVAVIIYIKVLTVAELMETPFWAGYSVVVTFYILSRFLLALFYRPRPVGLADADLPSVTIIVPAMNEQDVIRDTLAYCLGVDYPADRLQVIAVDDCSTDRTLEVMRAVAERNPGLEVVAFPRNLGKRHAMAEGVRRARGDILVFVDSDSLVRADGLRVLVRYFTDPRVGAVAGHTDVLNAGTNMLTRMQAVRYFIAFRVYKSAEAIFNSVTCCSGCFSGYRRSAVDSVLMPWLDQRFLGAPSTYGDDRSLTNFLLPDWKVLYAPDAQAWTVVPDSFSKFLRQQLRWKKSWIRESIRAGRFMWRKHPLMSLSFYLGIVLPLFAPQVVWHALVVQPFIADVLPVWYLGGVLAMAFVYGLYYRAHRRESLWKQGVVFALLYTSVLVWQMPYALATLRDSRWGTRVAGATPALQRRQRRKRGRGSRHQRHPGYLPDAELAWPRESSENLTADRV